MHLLIALLLLALPAPAAHSSSGMATEPVRRATGFEHIAPAEAAQPPPVMRAQEAFEPVAQPFVGLVEESLKRLHGPMALQIAPVRRAVTLRRSSIARRAAQAR